MYQKYVKRLLDITVSLVAIILLSPIYLILYVLIRIDMKGYPIFKQERPGFKGKTFKMYKFKTMKDATDELGRILSDRERLIKIAKSQGNDEILNDSLRTTKLGNILRASSLDELPELFNVLKGDMSLVGPRPLSTIYLKYYNSEEMKRHNVKPGITGLAQVNGRNSISWEKRFKYDIEYANNATFAMDFSILFKTIIVVFKKSDIGQCDEKPISFNIYREKQWKDEIK